MPCLRSIALVMTCLLAGCAADTGPYPSLAPRAVEKQGFAEPDTPPPATAAADPALDAKIVGWSTTLDTLAHDFADRLTKADRAVRDAHGAAAGSERWLDAQVALAALDDARAHLSAFTTDLDDASAARAATLAPVYPSLAMLHDRAAAQALAEDTAIARVQGMIATA